MANPSDFLTTPDQLGNFGPYGGRFVSETLMAALDELEEIKICYKYEDKNGKEINYMPTDADEYFDIKPVYMTVSGWGKNTFGEKNYKNLPKELLEYIKIIEDYTETPVSIVSTGPDRNHTMILSEIFD